MDSKIETTEALRKVLDKITFQKSCVDFDWKWEVEELNIAKRVQASYPDPDTVRNPKMVLIDEFKGWLINTTFKRPDITTGLAGTGKGRQLYVPWRATEAGVFFTCWVAVELIVKHELMESIRFDGKRVLNPHHDLQELSFPDVMKEYGVSPERVATLLEESWPRKKKNEN